MFIIHKLQVNKTDPLFPFSDFFPGYSSMYESVSTASNTHLWIVWVSECLCIWCDRNNETDGSKGNNSKQGTREGESENHWIAVQLTGTGTVYNAKNSYRNQFECLGRCIQRAGECVYVCAYAFVYVCMKYVCLSHRTSNMPNLLVYLQHQKTIINQISPHFPDFVPTQFCQYTHSFPLCLSFLTIHLKWCELSLYTLSAARFLRTHSALTGVWWRFQWYDRNMMCVRM